MALQHLRASTADKRPTPAAMADGQLAMNTNLASPGLFFKDSNGDLVKTGPVHVGTTAPNATPASGGQAGNSKGELWLDTTGSDYTLKTWDGSAWREIVVTSTMIKDGTIVNADVNASAAIAGTKISPDFGSQTIASTGLFSHALGTAGAPTITFTGDPNTGIYSPGADQLAISTNGSNRLYISSAGNVGIGPSSAISSPTAPLTVIGADNSTQAVIGASTGSTGRGLRIATATNVSNNDRVIFDAQSTTGAPDFRWQLAGSEKMALDSSGRLGLGTSSPGAVAHIQGVSGTYPTLIINHSAIDVEGEVVRIGRTDSVARYHSIHAQHTATNSTNYLQFRVHAGGAGAPFTSQSTVMTLTGQGNVGIGTTSPNGLLHVSHDPAITGQTPRITGTTFGRIDIEDAGTADGSRPFQFITSDDGSLIFGNANRSGSSTINSAERARIDSSGRVLIGTSTISESRTLHLQGNSGGTTQGAILGLARGETTPANGLALGVLRFSDSGHVTAAAIEALRDGGTWTSGSSQPTRLVFSTTADGASSPTERMRIDSSGNVGINRTSPLSPLDVGGLIRANTALTTTTSTTSIIASTNATTNTGNVSFESQTTSTASRFHFSFVNPNGVVGSISTNASATSYTTSSDYRLKENVVLLTGAIDRLQQIPVHRFNFIADPSTTVDGFIAHEAQEVVPECVTGTKDEVDEDGNPVYQGIDQSKLVPLLTAALQEALQKIEDLEGRLTTAGI